MKSVREIERSIIKKYRKDIWSKFIKAINAYELISDNDKIMVCISGGKDSFLLAKCMMELKKHGKINFDVYYVVMDPGYDDATLKKIFANAEGLGVPITVFKSDIFKVVDKYGLNSPCYLCARMRRGHLYNKAKKLGCNKIALGHHFDDVIETSLLSMFYGSMVNCMLPKLVSDNFSGLELIRPLYLVKEESILAWVLDNDLHFINCACSFTKKMDGKRLEMKKVIAFLRKLDSNIDYNLFKAMGNVNLNCVLGYRKDGVYHSFLDDYKVDS